MLIVKEDKSRPYHAGQIFVELISNRDVLSLTDWNRLGYWCDKEHLRHFILELSKVFTKKELEEILNYKITNGNECK